MSLAAFRRFPIPWLCLLIALALLLGKSHLPLPPTTEPFPHPTPAREKSFVLFYHERPPYYATGPLGVYGLCADPVKRAFRRAGISFHWERLPAPRQLEAIHNNQRRAGAVGWFKTPERLKFAKFSHPIYRDRPLIALGRADNARLPAETSLKRLLSDRDLVLLRKSSYSYGTLVDAEIAACSPRQITTDSNNLGMLEMIQAGRADYFFISPEEAEHLTETSGLLKSDFRFIHFHNLEAGNYRYIMYSRRVDEGLIKRVDEALASLSTSP